MRTHSDSIYSSVNISFSGLLVRCICNGGGRLWEETLDAGNRGGTGRSSSTAGAALELELVVGKNGYERLACQDSCPYDFLALIHVRLYDYKGPCMECIQKGGLSALQTARLSQSPPSCHSDDTHAAGTPQNPTEDTRPSCLAHDPGHRGSTSHP